MATGAAAWAPDRPVDRHEPLAARMRPRNLDEVAGQAAPARTRGAAAPAGAGRRAVVDVAVRTARHRQDHPRHAGRRLDRAALRPAVRGLGRRQGGPGGHRRRHRQAPVHRRTDRAVHRRGAPILPHPAGLAARRRRGPDHRADRRDHREPVLLGGLPVAVPIPGAAAATVDRRRHRRPGRPGGRRRTRSGRRVHHHRRGPRAPGRAGRRRRPARAHRARGGRGLGRRADRLPRPTRRPPSAVRSIWPPSSGRSTGRPCVTTGPATSTTTSPARSSSRSGAATSTPRCTTWPG